MHDIPSDDSCSDDGWEAEAMHCNAALAPPPGGAALFPDLPAIQHGRPPKMTYNPWRLDQGIQVGAVTVGAWYWRCPACRAWSGPYQHGLAGKQDGMDHRHRAHDAPAAGRAEARTAARRARKDITAARLDEITTRLTTAHNLTPPVIHAAISRTADAITGHHATRQDALFYTGIDLGTASNGDYHKAPHPKVHALIDAIATELGHPGWLTDMMASHGRSACPTADPAQSNPATPEATL